MAAIEFWARIGSDRTLVVPPEIAAQIDGDQPIHVVVILPGSAGEQHTWSELTTDQFLRGYDTGDELYDDVSAG
jgi:hypothetical protein